ncbi:MAG TPA: nitroreductase/quinone reductase family protein [Dehalococcoidia bacterium]|nr:nitroreductase/quinone reductase family protein [Dehalococcoidia bacterium]
MVDEFRANGGVVGGAMAGRLLLLLTATGAKSGLQRTTPLRYFADDGRLVVSASNLGAPHDPAWYRNLLKYPDVTVEVGSERFAGRARVLAGEERAQTWTRMSAAYPFLLEHQARTSRQLPLVALERRDR